MNEVGQFKPVDTAVDHVRGEPGGRLIVEYGEYECPYSRRPYREIELLERMLGGDLRFAFRHFPLTSIHPHALAASTAAEAAALQHRFWEMHDALHAARRRCSVGKTRFSGARPERRARRAARGAGARRGRPSPV